MGEIAPLAGATIVIPVYNQLRFTRQCLASLNAAGYADALIVVVDNASTDGTAEFLATRPRLRVITNRQNRACAAAWNQGFQARRTPWTVFLNNDTVLPPGWLESLIAFAEQNGLGVASPAMSEGELDYDLNTFARTFTARMKNVARRGTASGACFLVARPVFAIAGGFDENFTRGGHEDDDFFMRVRAAGFQLAASGSAYIHHYGSMTRRAVALERGSSRAETVGYFRQKWKLNWARRRWLRLGRKFREVWWAWSERLRHGCTLRVHRQNGRQFFR